MEKWIWPVCGAIMMLIIFLIGHHYMYSDSVTYDREAIIEAMENEEAIVKIDSETETRYYATAHNCDNWDLAKVGDKVRIKIYDKGIMPKILDASSSLTQEQQEKVEITSLEIGFFEKWDRK